MSSIASLTYPEFIFAHMRYELWCAGNNRNIKQYACSVLNSYLDKLSEVAMSTKKQQTQNSPQQWQKIEFVNINLSKAEKTQFKAWYSENQAALPELLTRFIAAGYKLSIKFDPDNDCFIATSTCNDTTMENGGKALSSRSDDWLEAIALNLFKTDVVSENGVWESSGGGNSWG